MDRSVGRNSRRGPRQPNRWQLNLSFTVPSQAWATSSVDVDLLHVANGGTIGTTAAAWPTQSGRRVGWRLNLDERRP